MVRRIAFGILILAALVCGTWGYLYLKDLKKPTLKPFDILPGNCYALIEVKEPRDFFVQLTQGNLMWEEFLKIQDIKKFSNRITALDSLFSDDEIREMIGSEPIYIALYGDEKKQDAVYAFNIPDIGETQKLTDFFEKNFSANKADGYLQCLWNNGSEKNIFYMFIDRGLILISPNEELTKSISAQKEKQVLSANASFNDAYKDAAKDKSVTVLAHFPLFRQVAWKNYFVQTNSDYFSDGKEKWFTFELGIQPSELGIHGFLPADSSVFSNALSSQDADDMKDLFSKLPYSTTSFEAINISEYDAFVNACYKNKTDERKEGLKKYSDAFAADAGRELSSLVGNYAANLEARFSDSLHSFGIVSVKDEDDAKSFLKNIADSTLANTDSANAFYFSDELLYKNICAGFFTRKYKYVSVIGECMLFCNSAHGIKEYRNYVTERNNFGLNERSMAFLSENFNSELNYLCYADVFKTKNKLQGFLSENMNEKLNGAPELFEKFDAVAFSLQKIKTKLFLNAQAGFNPKYKMYRNTLWETLVDTELYRLPDPVINHKTNENELVCQDKNNNLYLISNIGRVLWKKNIGEEILGSILQVDYFNNGKLQLLFATQNNIHLIDRNGNYIKDFPVKIKAGASGGITLFDYDKTRNYRLWLPLNNNTVVCLNSSCKPVEGFIPLAIKAPLAAPVQQIVIQQKDYFILRDTLGNIYVTNRKGEERMKITEKLPAGNPEVYTGPGKDIAKTFLCYLDVKTKTLRKLSLEGKTEKIELETKNEIHGYFFDTLGHSNDPLIVLLSENNFEAFDLFGKKIAGWKTKSDLAAKGTALRFADNTVYASLEQGSGTLILEGNKSRAFADNAIKLSEVPRMYDLISGQPAYMVGFFQNKIFCIKQ